MVLKHSIFLNHIMKHLLKLMKKDSPRLGLTISNFINLKQCFAQPYYLNWLEEIRLVFTWHTNCIPNRTVSIMKMIYFNMLMLTVNFIIHYVLWICSCKKYFINHLTNKIFFLVFILCLHQPGVDPGSIAWKATMLPLHHWCFGRGFLGLICEI